MLQSMTAFAKVKERHEDIEICIQLQSVNKKVLDIQVKAPPEWQFFEASIRKSISSFVTRGQLTVLISVHYDAVSCVQISLNMPYVLAMKEALLELAKNVSFSGLDAQELFRALVREKASFQQSFDIQKDTEDKLVKTLHKALKALVAMKEREGALLQKELVERITILQDIKQKILILTDRAPRRYRDKLTAILEEFSSSTQENQDRLAKEVALFADKIDITEELSRLGFHIDHFIEVCENKKKEPVGKVLEFILQELLREVNTIASKSQEAEISKLVINAKSEIEKMKEQVQNIE